MTYQVEINNTLFIFDYDFILFCCSGLCSFRCWCWAVHLWGPNQTLCLRPTPHPGDAVGVEEDGVEDGEEDGEGDGEEAGVMAGGDR